MTKCYQDLNDSNIIAYSQASYLGMSYSAVKVQESLPAGNCSKIHITRKTTEILQQFDSVRILQSHAFLKNTYTSSVHCQSHSVDQVYEIFTSNPVLTEQINTLSQDLLLKSWWLRNDCILARQTASLILQIKSENQYQQTVTHERITPSSSRSSIDWQQDVSYVFSRDVYYFECYYTEKG